ncbi:hypothetical protein B7486_63505, partial [cyanobacterium TDX16]
PAEGALRPAAELGPPTSVSPPAGNPGAGPTAVIQAHLDAYADYAERLGRYLDDLRRLLAAHDGDVGGSTPSPPARLQVVRPRREAPRPDEA